MSLRNNPMAQLAVYNSRKRTGDARKIQERMGDAYSVSFISKVLRAESYNKAIISNAYNLARRRTKNSDMVSA